VKIVLIVIVGVLIGVLWLRRRVAYQLRSGKLLARGSKVYANRAENPMLYWSSITLEALVMLFVFCTFALVLLGTKG